MFQPVFLLMFPGGGEAILLLSVILFLVFRNKLIPIYKFFKNMSFKNPTENEEQETQDQENKEKK